VALLGRNIRLQWNGYLFDFNRDVIVEHSFSFDSTVNLSINEHNKIVTKFAPRPRLVHELSVLVNDFDFKLAYEEWHDQLHKVVNVEPWDVTNNLAKLPTVDFFLNDPTDSLTFTDYKGVIENLSWQQVSTDYALASFTVTELANVS
jgi:hypothetical protein